MIKNGIKSKSRVTKFGEVYTPDNIVEDMLNLVKDQSCMLESTFLEPSCGNGNFIVKLLERKLDTARTLDLSNYDRNIFIAVSSIYAIDILPDNIEESKEYMINTIKRRYKDTKHTEINSEMVKVLRHVIDANIIWGDTLTGLRKDGINDDIIITEWSIKKDIVERRDCTFNSLTSNSLWNTDRTEYEPITFKKIFSAIKKDKMAS